MQTAKKLWLYSGLGVPSGVALVRPRPVVRNASWRRVLLVGGRAAQGVAPALGQLASCTGAALHVDVDDRATARDWARSDRLRSHITVFQPTSVIFALDPSDMLARRCVRARLSHLKALDFWMIPAGVPFPESARCLPAPEPHVEGHAEWAARAWSMVK